MGTKCLCDKSAVNPWTPKLGRASLVGSILHVLSQSLLRALCPHMTASEGTAHLPWELCAVHLLDSMRLFGDFNLYHFAIINCSHKKFYDFY